MCKYKQQSKKNPVVLFMITGRFPDVSRQTFPLWMFPRADISPERTFPRPEKKVTDSFSKVWYICKSVYPSRSASVMTLRHRQNLLTMTVSTLTFELKIMFWWNFVQTKSCLIWSGKRPFGKSPVIVGEMSGHSRGKGDFYDMFLY